MTLHRPDRADIPTGDTYQYVVECYLSSRGLHALNRRHLAQLRRGHVRPLDTRNALDVAALERWLQLVADVEFGHEYADPAHPHGMRKGLVLDSDKLSARMRERAVWVLRHWDKTKVERRSAGGRHGRANGVRKGPPPKFGVRDILPHYGLPPTERKARVMAETGMSESMFYKLMRQVPAALARIEERRATAIDPLDGLDPDAFLRGEDTPLRATSRAA
ncbi:hypothetical protein [Microbacterium sp. T2.11-28]|uniref:hypothetical protein n=1 Tax=Microbacterium sp. T2.11-28 TaxID=3041169 RepID=UPI0024774BE7|nr:hypothetical protein [Microbacterium sp. T2.11-28]CAI9386538.1 hypothetical protein MICABA_00449 [Microbacterium sp. T2.11-28]